MPDYFEMRSAIVELNRRFDVLDGTECLRGNCLGTLHRRGGIVVCDACGPFDEARVRTRIGLDEAG